MREYRYFRPDLNIACVGLGPFGLANCKHLTEEGYSIKAYDSDSDVIEHLRKTGRHPRFKHVKLSERLCPVASIDEAVSDADLVIMAVDSQRFRGAVMPMKGKLKDGVVILNLAKGLEIGEGDRKSMILSDVARDVLEEANFTEGNNYYLAAGGGGVFAKELIAGANVYMTMASKNPAVANDISTIFNSSRYHADPWHDIRGVELAGAMKNVIAIAKGIGDGIIAKNSIVMGIDLKNLPPELVDRKKKRFQIEHSSLCGMMSAYMNEMTYLAIQLGAKKETFSIGVQACGGDIMTTCFSNDSRNLEFGRRIVSEREKHTPLQIYEEMRSDRERKTVEGFPATKAFYMMVDDLNEGKENSKKIPFMLISETYRVLFEKRDPEESIRFLAKCDSMAKKTKFKN
jgi:glycerol-3-phosphate dehydrogenase (NAD(P)+)